MERRLRALLVDAEAELQMLVDLIGLEREKEVLLGQRWHVDELEGAALVQFIADSLDDVAHLVVGDLEFLVRGLLVGRSCKGEQEQERDGCQYFRFHAY